MPKLVLSNATTFFSGRLEAVFKKAKKLGFKYLEIVPYRWSTPQEILTLEQKYNIEVVGIHMPQWWKKPGWGIFTPLWAFYLGSGTKNPGPEIAQALIDRGRDTYLLLHSNLIGKMGADFQELKKRFHVVVENIPGDDPGQIQKLAGLAFDPGHFGKSLIHLPAPPEILHISYTPFHILPNAKEQQELTEFIRVYEPKYVVLETNPWVSVAKGKAILEEIIAQ